MRYDAHMQLRLDYIFDFLKDLKRNNTRAWMHLRATEKRFEIVRRTFDQLILLVMVEMGDYEDMRGIKPRACQYRIWRDARFSTNKAPCKTYLSALIRAGGRRNENRAAYYLQLEPGGTSFIGGGVWMPDADRLRHIRAAIARDGAGLAKVLANPKFKKTFGALELLRLKTMPRDYRKAKLPAAAMALLPYTSFVVGREVSDYQVLHDHFDQTISQYFQTLRPFNEWLNRALGN